MLAATLHSLTAAFDGTTKLSGRNPGRCRAVCGCKQGYRFERADLMHVRGVRSKQDFELRV